MHTSFIVTIHTTKDQTSQVMTTLGFSTRELAIAHIIELCKAGYLAYVSGEIEVEYA